MTATMSSLKIYFFGVGMDYPQWYKNNMGSTINASIDKFSYINVKYLPHFFRCKFCI